MFFLINLPVVVLKMIMLPIAGHFQSGRPDNTKIGTMQAGVGPWYKGSLEYQNFKVLVQVLCNAIS